MRHWFSIAFSTILALFSQSGTPSLAATPRTAVNLDADWKFVRQDEVAASDPKFDDSAWAPVRLPHTWNNLDGEVNDGKTKYYRGPGWYRRHLKLDASAAGKSLFIRFDGASIDTAVYVNGKQVGSHKGMFGAFCFDVTSALDPTGDNVIAVRVDNAHDKNVAPQSADFTFFGGIYRDVQLLELDPVSISPMDDASPGVYIKQSSVTADHAELEVRTQLRNASADQTDVTVRCDILDATGTVVKSDELKAKLDSTRAMSPDLANKIYTVQRLTINHPHLWNAKKDPYLYQARISVINGSVITDEVTQPLGLRFFRVDPNEGFFLNGKSYPLHGVNRHQDRIDQGWAITPAEHKEDFDLIMDMGCTGIRLAHYEHAQAFYNLCDQGGLVVWAELCLVNTVTDSPEFDDNARQQLRELIKQNYNHPAICFWSLFNELDAKPGVQKEHQIKLVTELNHLAKELDSTRLTTAASDQGNKNQLTFLTDVIAFNRYAGWYTGKATDWPALLDKMHQELPDRGVAISEYGAGASIFQHELDSKKPKTSGPWHPEEWQSTVHEQAWAAMKDRHWLWGTFAWCMFDFGSQGRREGDMTGRNDKGLVTYDRKTKKDAFYFYKANWSDASFVHITDARFTPRRPVTQPVKIYSNCDSVELTVNGKSLGSKSPDAIHVFIWPDVQLTDGDNQVKAVGSKAGKTFTDECTIHCDNNAATQPGK
jgi:beta-galactosidase